MKHLHISLFFSIYKQGYDSSDLAENPLLLLPKILGSFDAQNLNRLTVQKMGMLVSWQLRKLDFATFFKVWNLNFMGEILTLTMMFAVGILGRRLKFLFEVDV